MVSGRRKALRIHAFQQAALVWMGGEIDVTEFIERSDLTDKPSMEQTMDPQLRALRDQYVDQIMNTGKLII